MSNLSRRNFNRSLLHSLLTVSLVETLSAHTLLAKPVHFAVSNWLADVQEASSAMKKRQCSQREWQSKIADIFAHVEQKDLLKAIDFDRLSRKLKMVGSHEGVIETNPIHTGLPRELSFSTFIYGMKKGASIPPHCHRNMTSMHMPIGGAMHGWHFDRIADEAAHLIVQPTMDRALQIGEVTTISDEKDNVHWFQPTDEVAYTFNIGVYEIDSSQKFGGRQFYLDAAHGEKIGNGKLRVKKLKAEEAYQIYGNV